MRKKAKNRFKQLIHSLVSLYMIALTVFLIVEVFHTTVSVHEMKQYASDLKEGTVSVFENSSTPKKNDYFVLTEDGKNHHVVINWEDTKEGMMLTHTEVIFDESNTSLYNAKEASYTNTKNGLLRK